jgi:hypothetical protein
MQALRFLKRSSSLRAIAVLLAVPTLLCSKSFAAPDWSAVQSALNATGVELPGNVLRFELSRQDLTMTVNGQPVPSYETAAIANGYVAFKRIDSVQDFVDGALPAQETELPALEAALRANTKINITAIANHLTLESPKLVWVHFTATGNGTDLANSLAAALATIHSPQVGVGVILGTNSVFNASILPPKFLKLFDEGTIEQLNDIFVFYLPRPDEKRITVGPVAADTELGIGQSFYIQISLNGGSNTATLNIDFALRANEIQQVEDTLRAGGFTVSAQHNQFLGDTPHLSFVHASATGDGLALGNTLYEVIQIIKAHVLLDSVQ